MRERSRLWLDLAHVAALTSIAFVQPLYQRVVASPEFLLLHRANGADVAVVVLLFSLVVPVALWGLRCAAMLLDRRLGTTVQVLVVWTCATAVAMTAAERAGFAWQRQLLIGPIVGVGGAIAYARLEMVRLFVTMLAPAILVVPAVFVVRAAGIVATVDRDAALHIGTARTPAPVVLVVFDEFATTSLLDQAGDLDAVRFPNFARLARTGTWYRNATTVASVTQAALPALLTGRRPGPDPLADHSSRVANLFSLLAGSHALHVTESYVRFCPPWLCPRKRGDGAAGGRLLRDLAVVSLWAVTPDVYRLLLPSIAYATMLVQPGEAQATLARLFGLLGGQSALDREELGHRRTVFERFIDRIASAEGPTLHYLHVMLPHEPSVYLPSGTVCAAERRREPARWTPDARQVATAYERHLLQVGFVDTLVGRLIDRLESIGVWDEALVVLTADHGVSHRPGDMRRALTRTNHCDILGVPLFVKLPRQRSGGPSDRNVESIDVVPTVADVLGVEIPWPTDGASLLAPPSSARPHKHVVGPYWPAESAWFDDQGTIVLDPELARACLGLGRRDRWAGSIRPLQERLVGVPIAHLAVDETPAALAVELAGGSGQGRGNRPEGALPCPISGRLTGPAAAAPAPVLALALGGRIAAVVPAVEAGGSEATFTAVVTAPTVPGAGTDVGVYVVDAAGGDLRLRPVRDGA